MYSIVKSPVKIHSKARSKTACSAWIDFTLSSITTVTLSPIAMSRLTSNALPPGVLLSKMMQ
jgi:hypothetical protein